ncbi:MAG: PHP domain-containing protein [Thermodesulfobacteriota bacterium]
MQRIDLHLHSTCSDGTMSPEELVAEANRLGISAISITDHDTTAGTDVAMAAGRKRGIEIIAGIELSACHDDTPLHILGYGFCHTSADLQKKLAAIQVARQQRNDAILSNLAALGITLSREELRQRAGDGQTGRPHIAALLVEKHVVRTPDEAFARYLRRGGLAYAERQQLAAADAIALIREAGGIAVLAHPLSPDRTVAALPVLLEQLRDLGLGGAEAYYPTYSAAEQKTIVACCRELGLLVTGGSDFHGTARNGVGLGGGKKHRVPYELYAELIKRLEAAPLSGGTTAALSLATAFLRADDRSAKKTEHVT